MNRRQLIVVIGLLAAAAPAPAVVRDSAYSQPQTLVSVDGDRRLNLFCMGKGKPTVVLDAGAGGDAMIWRHVQGQIAAVTRVCAYDRAGYGFSDPATRPSDVRNTADDLHRLIEAGHVPTPIVYVGHSIAGIYGVYFDASYPHDVAGAVFVDPSFAHQDELFTAAWTPEQRKVGNALQARLLSDQRGCIDLARRGQLASLATPQAKACADLSTYPEPLDATLSAVVLKQGSTLASIGTKLSETESFRNLPGRGNVDNAELDAVHFSFGNKPLIILKHGKIMPPLPCLTIAAQASLDSAWRAVHDALAKMSVRGINIIVPNAGHYIQLDQPAAVIDAIDRVIVELRAALATVK